MRLGKKNKQRIIYFGITLIVLTAVVSWRTQRDRDIAAHESDEISKDNADAGMSYLEITAADQFKNLPRTGELFIQAGTLSATGIAVKGALSPQELPERHTVNLLFNITAKSLPQSPDDLADNAARIARSWRSDSKTIKEIVFRADAIDDPTALWRLASTIRTRAERDFSVGAFVRMKWLLEDKDIRAVRNSSKVIRTFYFDAADVVSKDRTMAEAVSYINNTLEFPYMIRVPAGTDTTALFKEIGGKPDFFVGFMIGAP